MTAGITIRRVSVEFLRPGPSHNQLLSPYTQYLAVCNDAGAAIVTVPYEQRVFERRLKELRYETGDESDRLEMLHEIGRDMGRILESVPGFTGALMHDPSTPGTLVHLRLTLSAAELALLPFELAEVPVGSSASALSIQTRPAVSVTRHIRTVSSDGLIWPDRPRILFVSSDPGDVPFVEHRAALVGAISRFQYPSPDEDSPAARSTCSADGRQEDFDDLLTILVNPTLVELQRVAQSAAYTHIHILTHGDLDAIASESYGLVLRDESGAPDVVSGERFVSAITQVEHRPAVVTIASCDSGNVGSVIVPGASFAHAVHQSGVPFVVGAQFPLSKDGSIPLTERLYNGLLWGEHPLYTLQRARAELHARYNTSSHDWASVVVYESLPASLEEQLDALRYKQARRAANAALEWVDKAVVPSSRMDWDSLMLLAEKVAYAVDRLPFQGQFAVECLGLRASCRKRLAQAAFTLAEHTPEADGGPFEDPDHLLDQARLDYSSAVKGLLVNDARAIQRLATLHWVLVQFVSLGTVLGQKLRTGEWEAAWLSSDQYRDHGELEQRAWAHGSLAELWLLRLANSSLSEEQRAECVSKARHHAEELSSCYPGVDQFPVKSTRRQFERYLRWWGDERFSKGIAGLDRSSWRGKDSVIETAAALAHILDRPPASGARKNGPKPSNPAKDGGAVAPKREPSPAATRPGRGGGGAKADPGATSRSTQSSSSALKGRSGKGVFSIEALPAGHGDCLWIEYGNARQTHRLLIDCGTQGSSKALLNRIDSVPENDRFLELFVLSHIDSDHIGGALPLFRAVKRGLRFGDVWFNGWRHVSGHLGARQGEMFSTAIQDFELPWNVWRNGGAILTDDDDLPEYVLPGGMQLTLLSPTRAQLDKLKPVWTRELKRYGLEPGGRADYSRFLRGTPSTIADAAALADVEGLADTAFGGDNGAPNGTSIALLAEFGGGSALLAADAHAPVLVNSIHKLLKKRRVPKLKVDVFKVSHHGSQNNVSAELIQLLDCSRYLISTNGDHFYHPDRQAIARILKYGGDRKTLYFNYRNRLNEVWGDDAMAEVRRRYKCVVEYPPAEQAGVTVSAITAID